MDDILTADERDLSANPADQEIGKRVVAGWARSGMDWFTELPRKLAENPQLRPYAIEAFPGLEDQLNDFVLSMKEAIDQSSDRLNHRLPLLLKTNLELVPLAQDIKPNQELEEIFVQLSDEQYPTQSGQRPTHQKSFASLYAANNNPLRAYLWSGHGILTVQIEILMNCAYQFFLHNHKKPLLTTLEGISGEYEKLKHVSRRGYIGTRIDNLSSRLGTLQLHIGNIDTALSLLNTITDVPSESQLAYACAMHPKVTEPGKYIGLAHKIKNHRPYQEHHNDTEKRSFTSLCLDLQLYHTLQDNEKFQKTLSQIQETRFQQRGNRFEIFNLLATIGRYEEARQIAKEHLDYTTQDASDNINAMNGFFHLGNKRQCLKMLGRITYPHAIVRAHGSLIKKLLGYTPLNRNVYDTQLVYDTSI